MMRSGTRLFMKPRRVLTPRTSCPVDDKGINGAASRSTALVRRTFRRPSTPGNQLRAQPGGIDARGHDTSSSAVDS